MYGNNAEPKSYTETKTQPYKRETQSKGDVTESERILNEFTEALTGHFYINERFERANDRLTGSLPKDEQKIKENTDKAPDTFTQKLAKCVMAYNRLIGSTETEVRRLENF